MHTWISYAVYYSDLDRLLVDSVDPLFTRLEPEVDRLYWTRHYAGGTHLRLHVRAHPHELPALAQRIEEHFQTYVAAHPSAPAPTYNAEAAQTLLEAEGEDLADYDLDYRVNVVVPVAHRRFKAKFASRDAALVLEAFYQALHPVVMAVLKSPDDKRTEMLRLSLLHPLVIAGAYEAGSVSFKSHWEGFRVSAPVPVVQLIEETYAASRETILDEMRSVLAWYKDSRSAEQATLYHWTRLEKRFVRDAYLDACKGQQLVAYADRDAWKSIREVVDKKERKSDFLETMHTDSLFFESLRYNPLFTAARVGINLLYLAYAAVGLHTYDKFMLCHAVQQGTEDLTGVDLTDMLKVNMKETIQMNPTLASVATH